jgi:hypothetical protein
MKPIHIKGMKRSNVWKPARRVWFQKNSDAVAATHAASISSQIAKIPATAISAIPHVMLPAPQQMQPQPKPHYHQISSQENSSQSSSQIARIPAKIPAMAIPHVMLPALNKSSRNHRNYDSRNHSKYDSHQLAGNLSNSNICNNSNSSK